MGKSEELPYDYWTPERQELVTKIMKSFQDELGKYGVPEQTFDKDQFGIKLSSRGGQHHIQAGKILMSESLWQHLGIPSSISMLGHEYAHSLAARILRNRKLRRGGLRLVLNDNNAEKIGDKAPQPIKFISNRLANTENQGIGFQQLEEAVVEKTASRVISKHFPDKHRGITQYQEYVEIVDQICKHIAETNPEKYKDEDSVFELFEQAEFGDGRMLPLTRAVESTYGLGSLTKIMVGMDKVSKVQKSEMTEVHKRLLEALRGEISLDEAIAARSS